MKGLMFLALFCASIFILFVIALIETRPMPDNAQPLMNLGQTAIQSDLGSVPASTTEPCPVGDCKG